MSKLIIANFKANKSVAQTTHWLESFMAKWSMAKKEKERHVVVAPSFLSLAVADSILKRHQSNGINLAVQDISPYSAGAYTGAVAGENLQGLAINYAILGHSERRKYFHETNNEIAMKVEQAVISGISPVVCLDQPYLETQIASIDEKYLDKCIFAFEPTESIGTGKHTDVGTVKKVVEKIKNLVPNAKVIYGGSVDVLTVGQYLLVTDGVLVASKSLNPNDFFEICMV